jgi:hypothetical protein
MSDNYSCLDDILQIHLDVKNIVHIFVIAVYRSYPIHDRLTVDSLFSVPSLWEYSHQLVSFFMITHVKFIYNHSFPIFERSL